jgi:Leucine-rich repeat (LRR) protein
MLQILDLSHCNLIYLPDCFVQMTSLVELRVTDNIIQVKVVQVVMVTVVKELPENIGKLVNLMEIDITNNLIEDLPWSMCKFIIRNCIYQ